MPMILIAMVPLKNSILMWKIANALGKNEKLKIHLDGLSIFLAE